MHKYSCPSFSDTSEIPPSARNPVNSHYFSPVPLPTHPSPFHLGTSGTFSQARTSKHILNHGKFKMEFLGGKTKYWKAPFRTHSAS